MDIVTHLSLGACIGEIWLGKKLGKKALLWGALIHSAPDLDTVSSLLLPADEAFLFHRGITHSLLFMLLAGTCLAWLLFKRHEKSQLTFASLLMFCCFLLLLHDALDVCNSYGTGLFEPFGHQRYSMNTLYVADPLFTIGIFVAAVYIILGAKNKQGRSRASFIAVSISAGYLLLACGFKIFIDAKVNSSLKKAGISSRYYFSTPTPLTSMLWFIVVKDNTTYYTAYRSVWDSNLRKIEFTPHPQNTQLLLPYLQSASLKNLRTFAGLYYTVSGSASNVSFNVLRFGQVQGWQNANAPFVLSYPLSATEGQAALLQQRRMAGWNGKSVKVYFKRIIGQ